MTWLDVVGLVIVFVLNYLLGVLHGQEMAFNALRREGVSAAPRRRVKAYRLRTPSGHERTVIYDD